MIITRASFEQHRIVIERPSPKDNQTPATVAPDAKPTDGQHEFVTIDLHVGHIYWNAGQASDEDATKEFILPPNGCLVIKTQEILALPTDVFGYLCSRGSLSAQGLLVANTKIDPKFHGNLDIPVFNASKYPIRIAPGQSFCSVFFALLERPIDGEAPLRSPPTRDGNKRSAFKTSVTLHLPIVFQGLIFIATLGACLAAWWPYMVAPKQALEASADTK